MVTTYMTDLFRLKANEVVSEVSPSRRSASAAFQYSWICSAAAFGSEADDDSHLGEWDLQLAQR